MSTFSKCVSLFSLAGVAGLVLIATALPSKADTSDGKTTPVVRDHRKGVVIRDHRQPEGPVVRDHRHPVKPVVRDHRNGGSTGGGVTVSNTSTPNTPTSNTPTKDKSDGGGHRTCGQLIIGGPKVCVTY
jgi:hypothetical protein